MKRPKRFATKVVRVLSYMNREHNTPRTVRQMFDAQTAAVNALRTPGYIRRIDAVVKRHGFEDYADFVSHVGSDNEHVNKRWREARAETYRVDREFGLVDEDYSYGTFTSHVHNNVTHGHIRRHGLPGNYTYTLHEDDMRHNPYHEILNPALALARAIERRAHA